MPIATPAAYAVANATTRASIGIGGVAPNGDSTGIDGVSISRDGHEVAFESTASNLVPNDTNGVADAFVRDLVNGVTTRVSVNDNGGNANAGSSSARLSGDGRFVAFTSAASNLVLDDGNGQPDVFVRDLATGATVRASVADTGGDPNASTDPDSWSRRPSISADGHLVAFESHAANLMPVGGTDSASDIFVRDLVAGTTTQVSVNTAAVEPDGYSTVPAISGNGRYVVFASEADDLVANDLNNVQDIFRRDLTAATTIRVSVDTTGADPDKLSTTPSVSDTGNVIVFRSPATDLVAADTNAVADVFARNVTAGTTTRVSVDTTGADADAPSYTPAVSADGKTVAFVSNADDLVAGDGTLGATGRDVFLRDLAAGTTLRLSVSSSGGDPNERSLNPAVSATGRVVAFASAGSNLVASDGNAFVDVFVRDRGPGGAPLVSIGDTSSVETNAGTYVVTFAVRLSAAAASVITVPFATALNADFGAADGIAPAVVPSDYVSASGTLSFAVGSSARYVSVTIRGDTLVEPDEDFTVALGVPTGAVVADGWGRGLIRADDLGVGAATTRVSVDSDPADADLDNPNQASRAPSISADGRMVAFESQANDLVADDTGATDVFVRDLAAGTMRRVSVDRNGDNANGPSTVPKISADGRYVVFTSTANDLVPVDTNAKADVFVRDLLLGTTTNVSVDTAGLASNGDSTAPSISGDGRLVAFQSTATDLVASDANGATGDVFVRDLVAGTTVRLGGLAGQGATITPDIAAAGRYVAVVSKAPLVAADAGTLNDIYRFDLNTSTWVRASVDTAGSDPNAVSAAPTISDDGNKIAFDSRASDLVTGDGNALSDVFVRTMGAGTTALVSKNTAAASANGTSTAASISGDGLKVGFLSAASDLGVVDGNGFVDAYVRAASGGGTPVRVSADTGGLDANAATIAIALDRDGRFPAFATDASDVIPNDTNTFTDIGARDLGGAARVSIGDVTVSEGNGQTVDATFTITRTAAAPSDLAVVWATAPGTAATPADFTTAGGTATIPTGASSVTVTVVVKGETVVETDESFRVVLSSAASSVLVDPTGVGVISGDELP